VSFRSPVSKNIGETEVLVIRERMEIEEVANVDVLQTERVRFAVVRLLMCARRLVIDLLSDIAKYQFGERVFTHRRMLFSARYSYLYSLNLELDVSVLRSAVEFRVPVDVIHGGDVVCDQGQYFLPGFLHVVMQLRTRTLNICGNCPRLLYFLFYATW